MLSRDKVISEEELKRFRTLPNFLTVKISASTTYPLKLAPKKRSQRISEKYDIDENVVSQVIINLKEDKWINDAQLLMLSSMPISFQETKGPYVLISETNTKRGSKIYYRREVERI